MRKYYIIAQQHHAAPILSVIPTSQPFPIIIPVVKPTGKDISIYSVCIPVYYLPILRRGPEKTLMDTPGKAKCITEYKIIIPNMVVAAF